MDTLTHVALGFVHKAFSCYQSGQLAEAEGYCRTVLKIDSGNCDAQNLIGLVAFDRGDDVNAEKYFRLALKSNPVFAIALSNLGMLLRRQSRFDEALFAYGKAVSIQPDFSSAHYNRGNLLKELGRFEEAFHSFEQAILHDRQDADAYNGCGSVLWKLGRLEDSLPYFDKAFELDPLNTDAYVNKGVSLEGLGRQEDALKLFDQALSIDPDKVSAIVCRGSILDARGDVSGALALYLRAQEIDPGHAQAIWGEGMCRLYFGQYESGWKKYESRWELPEFSLKRKYGGLRWGGELLNGKTLLVFAEQGLGDTLQFCRFIPFLKAYGGEIVFEVQAPLAGVIATNPEMGVVVARGSELPPYDYHIPLLSLLAILNVSIQTIPCDSSYLCAPESAAKKWQGKTGLAADRKKVGVVWRTTTKGERTRDIPVVLLAPLFELGLDVFVAQKELDALEKEFLDSCAAVRYFDDELTDFSDTAALIAEMDAVISIDTSVAHLAGALGKPVFIALPYAGEWRWLENRADSPWYPTATLFRQKVAGDWTSVLADLTVALSAIRDASK